MKNKTMKQKKINTVVGDVRLTTSSRREAKYGLLGWVSFELDYLVRVDGVALRRTASGRLALSFPAHRDRSGRQHPYVRPLDDSRRREIERQIFRALGLEEEHAS